MNPCGSYDCKNNDPDDQKSTDWELHKWPTLNHLSQYRYDILDPNLEKSMPW